MDRKQRLQSALERKPTDRAPYAFWRHFPAEDRDPRALARATLEFQERWSSDFIKVTFAGGYAVEDWGCVESDRVEADGHRPCARHGVSSAGDWERIRPLDPRAGSYGRALEALRLVADGHHGGAPVIPTLFSPLSLARKLSGDRLSQDLRDRPRAVERALEAIAETQVRFAAACLDSGAAGVFFSIQAASARHHSEEDYARFGEPLDRRVLESIRGRSTLTVLHAHGEALFFDRLAALPAQALNWDDRAAGPPLGEGKARARGAVIGGLGQWKTLRTGTPDQVRAEVEDALRQTGGLGVIVGPGCVLPPDTPETNLGAVVEALAR